MSEIRNKTSWKRDGFTKRITGWPKRVRSLAPGDREHFFVSPGPATRICRHCRDSMAGLPVQHALIL